MTYYQYISDQPSAIHVKATVQLTKSAESKYLDELTPEISASKAAFESEKIAGLRHTKPFKLLSISNPKTASVKVTGYQGDDRLTDDHVIGPNDTFYPSEDWIVTPGQELRFNSTGAAEFILKVAGIEERACIM